ncbi:MAG: ADP-forming succinate--CoA ligase subunit beta [Thaumarchaeota archaeon]|nr:ADP-forming succinate--CoA ligase subunit beta [Candidatus Calditenuaceae archaeon]MDW8042711.1 ADP-forming succinate--CoA ligase subunit beta [Nitrososphaerota archaeon]
MKLYEHEAVELFNRYNIPAPKSFLASTPEEARRAVERLGGQAVLKAQVLVGGRGKAGGIRAVRSPEEAEAVARELLSMRIRGEAVRRLLVAELVRVSRELYLSLTVDRTNRGHVLLASPMGGVDIEEIAATHPDRILRLTLSPLVGIRDYHVRKVHSFLGVPGELAGDLSRTLRGLYSLYADYGCELAEINPLAVTEDGRLLALDAKVIVDDNFARVNGLKFERERDLEEVARELGFSYVELDGNIGVICNGAGLTMATMDLVKHYGGRPANFLDIGGGADAKRVESAVSLLLSKESVKVVFVNVLGGITRCDEVATGLVRALKSSGRDVKLVVRLVGTREEEGQRILKENGYEYFRSMEEAARRAVELAREA